jgi:hypothetical protein
VEEIRSDRCSAGIAIEVECVTISMSVLTLSSPFLDAINNIARWFALKHNRARASYQTPHPLIVIKKSARLILNISTFMRIDRDGIAKVKVPDAFDGHRL